MNTINKFIERVISEAALDNRVKDGIIDLHNLEHIQVVAETIYDSCEDENMVNEFVEEFMEEGKYPDRQAFNKEGWLVTFPSKEYRDNAIKKGTHSISDPTHGKGGMNLYYKRKGKQKRQTQQQATVTKDKEDVTKSAPAPGATTGTAQVPSPKEPVEPADKEKRANRLAKLTGQPVPGDTKAPTAEPEASGEKVTSPEEPAQTSSSAPAIAAASAAPQPTPEPPTPDYEKISKKFVAQKRWMPTPFGEYRDTQGNSVAVVGLSGEIVPIKNTDREEYKLFAEKNAPQQS